jgi:folate-binding protein YgfZ
VPCSGADAASFLQGLTTNDVRALVGAAGSASGAATAAAAPAQFTAFLNSKGRTLFEATLSLAPQSAAAAAGDAAAKPLILVDVDAAAAPALRKHLLTYKLRAKVEVLDLSASHAVWAVLPTDPFALSLGGRAAATDTGHDDRAAIIAHMAHAARQRDAPTAVYADPRVAGARLGIRAVAPRELQWDGLALPPASPLDYHCLRLLHGVPEGGEVADAIPGEWNIAFLNGVSFTKGCYVGQELVARTHFRGLVRKRYVPVYFTAAGAPPRPVACSDPIAAALVRHTDEAMARRAGVSPGGAGHGAGHGPAQKHDFPEAAAPGHEQRHSRIHSPTGKPGEGVGGPHVASPASHAGLASGGGSGGKSEQPTGQAANEAAASGEAEEQRRTGAKAAYPLRIPFPFVDRAWRGSVAAGDTLVGAGEEDKGARTGRVTAAVHGLNIGLALLRLDSVAHVFPRAPHASKATETVPDDQAAEGEGDAAAAEAAAGAAAGRKGAGSGAGLPFGDLDFSDEDTVQSFHDLHARCKTATVNLKTQPPAATSGAGAAPARQAYRATPVLPLWWRHVTHAGLEVVPSKTAPNA